MSYIRGRGEVILPFATTGLAATLLKGGRTVHSGFQLPVPLNETSTSKIKSNSDQAKLLRSAKAIIIDEITILSKHGLWCIDDVLKDIEYQDSSNKNKLFGNKVIIISGDFRQTLLPVVPKGTRTIILETCIKSGNLWNKFINLKLIKC